MRACLLVGVALCLPVLARAELAAIWAVDDGTKVKATDLSHPLKKKNGIFDAAGLRVTLFGARNETVSFQLILEGAEAQATAGVRVRLDAVGPIDNVGLTGAMDSYFVGRNIELFEEHYLQVTTRSHDLSWAPGSAAEPFNITGQIPDALIPLGTARTLTVPAARNQGVWIDLYIPKDTAPGTHQGTVVTETNGVACALPACSLPLTLQVLPVTLPDAPTVKTMLFFSGSENDRDLMWARYSADPWSDPIETVEAMRLRHFKLGRRLRITLFLGDLDLPDDNLKARINGQAFLPAAGYGGPGEGVGQDMYSIHTYGGSLTAPEATAWRDWFAQNNPAAEYFLYVIDEPSESDFPDINATAVAAKPVPSFVTHGPADGLEVDIYCTAASEYSVSGAQAATAQGKRVWIYNGYRPNTGTFVVDDVAVSPRVNPWIQYKYGIPRWFYWESTYYNDFQGGRGNVDVFSDPINFTNAWGDEMNGDGLLIYPGRDLIFPAQDRGFDGPMPSIRLMNWRRGIQDVEYLALARAAGHQALVDEVVGILVPRALDDDLSASDPVAWVEDGEEWLRQRRRLADALAGQIGPDGGPDAGVEEDGGDPGFDAGFDAGPDAGSDPGPDKGGGTDDAAIGDEDQPPGSVSGTCSCASSSLGLSLGAWLLLCAWLLRRRGGAHP